MGLIVGIIWRYDCLHFPRLAVPGLGERRQLERRRQQGARRQVYRLALSLPQHGPLVRSVPNVRRRSLLVSTSVPHLPHRPPSWQPSDEHRGLKEEHAARGFHWAPLPPTDILPTHTASKMPREDVQAFLEGPLTSERPSSATSQARAPRKGSKESRAAAPRGRERALPGLRSMLWRYRWVGLALLATLLLVTLLIIATKGAQTKSL